MNIFHFRRLHFVKKKCLYILLFILLITLFMKCFELVRSMSRKNADEVKVFRIYKKYFRSLNDFGEYDISGRYKQILQDSGNAYEMSGLTLVSQCSANHLHYLHELLKIWKGPISVAVFGESQNIPEMLWDIAMVRFCNPGNKELYLHIIVPAQEYYYFKYVSNMGFRKKLNCDAIPFSHPKNPSNYNWSIPYPINLLRNIAKRASPTDYVLVSDIDMIPSTTLRSDFLTFKKLLPLDAINEAFVVPAFEVPEEASVPLNKRQLKASVNLLLARPFYVQLCKECHEPTRYKDWLADTEETGTTTLYEVEWHHPWEPFFIARRDMPDYDERFEQYGMNRVSQLCELHVAGYKFSVLSNNFLVHKGYKLENSFHKTKNKEMYENRKIYNQFKSELRFKYPTSTRHCYKAKRKSNN